MTVEFLAPDWPAPPSVRALVTTRAGGVSTGRWAGLNLGDACGDDPQAVAENRRRLRQHLPSGPCWLHQVHGSRVVECRTAGQPREADAAVTSEPGRVCAVLTADCLPVLVCNRQGTRVAAAHAGWRGLLAGVLESTVGAFDQPPGELIAWLGPAIGPAAYQVGGEVRRAFMQLDAGSAAAFTSDGRRWRADLYALARLRLSAAGLAVVHGGGWCTHGDPRRFYSYRRDGVTGRMASLAWIR
jgi:YfiH family protein